MRIAVMGERWSDDDAIVFLLGKRFPTHEFFRLLSDNDFSGSELDNTTNNNRIRREFELEQPDLVILSRDLDTTEQGADYTNKIKYRKAFFTKFRRIFNRRTLKLLHIYELEALILADIKSFNLWGDFNVKFDGNPMWQEETKEFLKTHTKGKFQESDNADLFKQLDYETLRQNCQYFSDFSIELESILANLN